MLEIKKDKDGYTLDFHARAPQIYLDHWAIREISSNDELYTRFFNELSISGTLMISNANLVEILGNTGESLIKIKKFLNDVKDRWFPIEISPTKVLEEEKKTTENFAPFCSNTFLRPYYEQLPTGAIQLGNFVDLIANDNKSDGKKLEEIIQKGVVFYEETKNKWKMDKEFRKKIFPVIEYDPEKPQRYVYYSLMRLILKDDIPIKRNDVLDIWHLSVSCAYGNLVLLDKKWANLIKKLNIPQERTRIYSKNQMNEFFQDFRLFSQAYVAKKFGLIIPGY